MKSGVEFKAKPCAQPVHGPLGSFDVFVTVSQFPVVTTLLLSVDEAREWAKQLLDATRYFRLSSPTPRPMCKGCEHDCAECICASAEVIK